MKWINHQVVTGVIMYAATEDLLLTACGMAGAILPDKVEGSPRRGIMSWGWRSRHRGWSHWPLLYVAVIGLPDPRLGEIAAAVVELVPGVDCTVEDIQEFCQGMPRYKRPRRIILAPVPRNATGKIEKPKLRKLYGGEGLVDSQNKS